MNSVEREALEAAFEQSIEPIEWINLIKQLSFHIAPIALILGSITLLIIIL